MCKIPVFKKTPSDFFEKAPSENALCGRIFKTGGKIARFPLAKRTRL